jgi:hypothetical protein
MEQINTSQDPDYVGQTGHEKKLHKTHFGVVRTLGKRTRVQDDPTWYEYAPGRWRRRNNDSTASNKSKSNPC